MRETALQTSRSVQKEGVGVLQALEQRFLCVPGADHGEGSVALQTMEDHGHAEIHARASGDT